ncbi:MAG: NAD-dependent epimerase/dehydratase family protein [Pelagibacteraceae bacterium]|jgi:UDP-glucose 4-epimerase|nr:NAD-dependent epimerase/dehydratase family protein [Pelagibacteraceae bacterium]MBT6170900.1 NAD-dependent epimerase/dehydratase family protein [Flavobacteriaceae bacterium]MBT6448087.1 NAD-dependent epimerase/dehydratase family protein [Flavobacteriaceae bacterium]MBT7623184.1 NAD-dependent epimerase/dehydratase family protein [Flavobacteriaceae bacterium]
MKKKVLVTGGVGFIGSNLIKELKNKDFEVVSLDNYSTGDKKNEISGVTYINDDIINIFKLDNDFDICFHLAAQSRVQPSFEDPEESLRVNVIGTSKVMDWAHKNKIKVVYAGSSSKHHDPSDSPYAMYKFLGEEVCKLYKKSFKVNVEISRFYNVYGPGENIDEKFGNVIGIWSAKIQKKEPIPIVGDGEQKRDFIHVFDLVEGLIKIAKTDLIHDDAWELGTGVNYSVNELYNFFKEKYNVKSIYIPDQPGNYRKTLRINDDALKLLNWKPNDRLKSHIENLNL